jgi:hypothetical protein
LCVLTTVADSASAVLAQAKFEAMELKILWAQIQQGASVKASGCSTRADTRIHTSAHARTRTHARAHTHTHTRTHLAYVPAKPSTGCVAKKARTLSKAA